MEYTSSHYRYQHHLRLQDPLLEPHPQQSLRGTSWLRRNLSALFAPTKSAASTTSQPQQSLYDPAPGLCPSSPDNSPLRQSRSFDKHKHFEDHHDFLSLHNECHERPNSSDDYDMSRNEWSSIVGVYTLDSYGDGTNQQGRCRTMDDVHSIDCNESDPRNQHTENHDLWEARIDQDFKLSSSTTSSSISCSKKATNNFEANPSQQQNSSLPSQLPMNQNDSSILVEVLLLIPTMSSVTLVSFCQERSMVNIIEFTVVTLLWYHVWNCSTVDFMKHVKCAIDFSMALSMREPSLMKCTQSSKQYCR
jgi:hypothetical protein